MRSVIPIRSYLELPPSKRPGVVADVGIDVDVLGVEPTKDGRFMVQAHNSWNPSSRPFILLLEADAALPLKEISKPSTLNKLQKDLESAHRDLSAILSGFPADTSKDAAGLLRDLKEKEIRYHDLLNLQGGISHGDIVDRIGNFGMLERECERLKALFDKAIESVMSQEEKAEGRRPSIDTAVSRIVETFGFLKSLEIQVNEKSEALELMSESFERGLREIAQSFEPALRELSPGDLLVTLQAAEEPREYLEAFVSIGRRITGIAPSSNPPPGQLPLLSPDATVSSDKAPTTALSGPESHAQPAAAPSIPAADSAPAKAPGKAAK